MTDLVKVLIVDDEPGMRLGVERALRHFTVQMPDVDQEVHFATDQAETGEQALEKIEAELPDIILLDHKLPGISGLEVLERIEPKVRAGDTLTIMITAYASLDTAITATKRGAYDFLAKPFTPDELKNAVRKAAGRLVLTRQARRLAAEKRQVRFQFISVVAHELKAPLAAIEGYLNILKDGSAGTDPAAAERMIDRSLIRAQQARKLVTDLLDLTRIEAGTKKRELAELDVTEPARNAIESVAPDAAARGITVQLHAEGPVTMMADRGELEIVLNNLVSNAVKYNRDGGRVDVRLAREGPEVVIAVADTGIGMSAEETQRLFGEFVRIRNEKTRSIMGSGLGLSIIKKLAILYGGDVSVASEPDVGTTFTVRLQADPPEAEATAQDAQTPPAETTYKA